MIPLVDLKAQYESIKTEVDSALQRVIESTAFVSGPDVREFEGEFADFCGAEHGVGVASGTAALYLSLLALDIGPGDEVITTPATFFATVAEIARVGAHPVLVDVDRRTCNIDPERLEGAVTARTRAVIPVHMYGQPADMGPIRDIAERHRLHVIEDAAQAHGAEYRGSRAGSMGDLGCFSFYPAKNLGAYGDAGAVTTNSVELADKVRGLRDHGRADKYTHAELGTGERLDTIQAAILRVKLRRLEEWTEARIAAAKRYDGLLADLQVELPHVAAGIRHVFHLYVIQVDNRDRVLAELNENGIGAGVHYPLPLHLQPALRHLGYGPGDFPETESAADRVLSLPLYPELTDSQAGQVVDALAAALATV